MLVLDWVLDEKNEIGKLVKSDKVCRLVNSIIIDCSVSIILLCKMLCKMLTLGEAEWKEVHYFCNFTVLF